MELVVAHAAHRLAVAGGRDDVVRGQRLQELAGARRAEELLVEQRPHVREGRAGLRHGDGALLAPLRIEQVAVGGRPLRRVRHELRAHDEDARPGPESGPHAVGVLELGGDLGRLRRLVRLEVAHLLQAHGVDDLVVPEDVALGGAVLLLRDDPRHVADRLRLLGVERDVELDPRLLLERLEDRCGMAVVDGHVDGDRLRLRGQHPAGDENDDDGDGQHEQADDDLHDFSSLSSIRRAARRAAVAFIGVGKPPDRNRAHGACGGSSVG
jgi:hypothetical protein